MIRPRFGVICDSDGRVHKKHKARKCHRRTGTGFCTKILMKRLVTIVRGGSRRTLAKANSSKLSCSLNSIGRFESIIGALAV